MLGRRAAPIGPAGPSSPWRKANRFGTSDQRDNPVPWNCATNSAVAGFSSDELASTRSPRMRSVTSLPISSMKQDRSIDDCELHPNHKDSMPMILGKFSSRLEAQHAIGSMARQASWLGVNFTSITGMETLGLGGEVVRRHQPGLPALEENRYEGAACDNIPVLRRAVHLRLRKEGDPRVRPDPRTPATSRCSSEDRACAQARRCEVGAFATARRRHSAS